MSKLQPLRAASLLTAAPKGKISSLTSIGGDIYIAKADGSEQKLFLLTALRNFSFKSAFSGKALTSWNP